MKKLIASLAMTALSFSLFADEAPNWFEASFNTNVVSTGGEWVTNDVTTVPTFVDETYLELEDVEADHPVMFKAAESKSPEGAYPVTIKTKVHFEPCEELPVLTDDEIKTALVALSSSNYFVVAYDSTNESNYWYDTGIAYVANPDYVDVQIEVKDSESPTAKYLIDSEWVGPVSIRSAELQSTSFSGNGKVCLLTGEYQKSPTPTETYTVTFSTNHVVEIVNEDVNHGTQITAEALDEAGVTELIAGLSGKWDANPTNAVVVCDTNFNFSVSSPTPVEPVAVDFSNAQVGGLNVTFDPAGPTALPGTEITATYSNGTKIGSGTRVFVVQDDGSLQLKSGQDPLPEAQDPAAKIGTQLYLTFDEACGAANNGDTIVIMKDAELESIAAIKSDITIDANGFVVELGNYPMSLTNNVAIICSGTTTEKGVKNNAQITIAAGKTLDLSALSWGAGVIGSDPTTAAFTLEAGATYKQGLGNWDDSITNIFSAVEGYAITLAKDTSATISTVKLPTPVTPEIQLSVTNVEYFAEIDFPTVTVKGYTEGTDYDKSWTPDAITEPAAGATNEYTVTVTMKGDYTGSNTAKFYVWKAVPPPTMWNVTFSTNTVAVGEYDTEVQDGQSLTVAQIPVFTGGAWDVDPSTAVITCDTNFNYTIETKSYPPMIPDGKKGAYDTWKAKYPEATIDPEAAITKQAFLLDCAPDDSSVAAAKAEFKIASIAYVEGEWVVTVKDEGSGHTYKNGVVTIVPYVISGAAGAQFFQAVLDWATVD